MHSFIRYKMCYNRFSKNFLCLFICLLICCNLLLFSRTLFNWLGCYSKLCPQDHHTKRLRNEIILETESHKQIRIINDLPHQIVVAKSKTSSNKTNPRKNDFLKKKFTVIKNYIPATGGFPDYNSSVTFTTQATYDFLEHVEVICRRWDGPISLAVYAPDTDLEVTIRKILFMRQCGPSCVSTNVSWHIIYEEGLGPPPSYIRLPSEVAKMDLYEPLNCSAGIVAMNLTSNARKIKKLLYPINVARNVARLSAKTKFVLAADIELYPSLNMVSSFLEMLNTRVIHLPNQVYHLPVFEIKPNVSMPDTKLELVQLFNRSNVMFFHKLICDECHAFPRRKEWLKHISDSNTMTVFNGAKRDKSRHKWEPFYISTNSIPLFDERFTWNGKINKMTQVHELCRLGFDFLTLDNAFLVHAPGIKTFKEAMDQQKTRTPYMAKNNAIFRDFKKEMDAKYGTEENC